MCFIYFPSLFLSNLPQYPLLPVRIVSNRRQYLLADGQWTSGKIQTPKVKTVQESLSQLMPRTFLLQTSVCNDKSSSHLSLVSLPSVLENFRAM